MAEKTNDVQRNWLQAYYKETVVPALIKEFNYTNINQVPKIEKIVLNMGLWRRERQRKEFATRR